MESASTISFMYILYLFYVISRSDFFSSQVIPSLAKFIKKN